MTYPIRGQNYEKSAKQTKKPEYSTKVKTKCIVTVHCQAISVALQAENTYAP